MAGTFKPGVFKHSLCARSCVRIGKRLNLPQFAERAVFFCREEMRNGADIWGHSSSPAPFRLISTADLTGGREQGAGSLQGQ